MLCVFPNSKQNVYKTNVYKFLILELIDTSFLHPITLNSVEVASENRCFLKTA